MSEKHAEHVTEALRLLNEADEPKYRAPADRTIESVDDLNSIPCEPPLDGSDPTQDNITRAAFAASAVTAYANATGNNDLDTVISDMLGDLQHLLDVLSAWDGDGVGTIDSLVESGSVHYEAEIRGEF